MAQRSRSTFMKRQKELARQQRRQDKLARRTQRTKERPEGDPLGPPPGPPAEDPAIPLDRGLEDVVQLLGPHDRQDQFHDRASGRSGMTRIAPSPLVYASSPCCGTSIPTPSSFFPARTAETKPTSFKSAYVPATL